MVTFELIFCLKNTHECLYITHISTPNTMYIREYSKYRYIIVNSFFMRLHVLIMGTVTLTRACPNKLQAEILFTLRSETTIIYKAKIIKHVTVLSKMEVFDDHIPSFPVLSRETLLGSSPFMGFCFNSKYIVCLQAASGGFAGRTMKPVEVGPSAYKGPLNQIQKIAIRCLKKMINFSNLLKKKLPKSFYKTCTTTFLFSIMLTTVFYLVLGIKTDK